MSTSTQTVNEYLENSEKLIKHAKETAKENPKKACEMASKQLQQHIKLLERVV